MIFYFSGTGNSLYAAKNIASYNKESIISISEIVNTQEPDFKFQLKESEIIGFVFPVYAWGPPEMVLKFIDKLVLENFNDNYIFAVATCGENIGNTMKLLDKRLKNKNIKLSSGFSVKMPNNYIIMGDVDSRDEEGEKLAEAEKSFAGINKIIEQRQKDVFKLRKGFLATALTGIVNPMFNKHAMEPGKFFADDSCTGCRICETVCNCKTIKVDKKPVWGSKCSQCLACIHYCPERAIQYGIGTRKKGRYTNPNVKISI